MKILEGYIDGDYTYLYDQVGSIKNEEMEG